MIKIIIPGNPIAKTRPRLSNRRVFDDQVHLKSGIKNFIFAEIQNQGKSDIFPIKGPVQISFEFRMPIPESVSLKQKVLMSWNVKHHTKKPDFDNLEKFYLDAGTGLLYEDDRYVCKCSTYKLYSDTPCTIIKVKPMETIDQSEQTLKVMKSVSPDTYAHLLKDIASIGSNFHSWKKHLEEGDIGPWLEDSLKSIKTLLTIYEKELRLIKDMKIPD